MYISPLLLLVPEFAADYAEENEQLFDTICLRKYEDLDELINEINGYDILYDIFDEDFLGSFVPDVFARYVGTISRGGIFGDGDGSGFPGDYGRRSYGFGDGGINMNLGRFSLNFGRGWGLGYASDRVIAVDDPDPSESRDQYVPI